MTAVQSEQKFFLLMANHGKRLEFSRQEDTSLQPPRLTSTSLVYATRRIILLIVIIHLIFCVKYITLFIWMVLLTPILQNY